jgi:hypothetical protein
LVWGALSLAVSGKLADVSVLVIAMTSIQLFATGLLADLVSKRILGANGAGSEGPGAAR